MPLREFQDRYPALTKRLCQAKQAGRVAHAYLVTGDHTEQLEAFVAAWLQVCTCETPAADGDACGACPTCRQVAAETYPEMVRVKPVSKSRQIRLEKIYELERALHLSTGGRTRLAVIIDADRMNIQTQNAFLKSLEEPTPNTIIVLITKSPSMLLPTIRSRCQTIALLDNRMDYDFEDDGRLFQALARLQPESGASAASVAAQGVIDCLQELRQSAEAESKSYIRELTANAAEMDPAYRKQVESEAEAFVQAQYKGRREEVLSAIHTWFAQQFIRSSGVGQDLLPNPEIFSDSDNTPPAAPEARRSLKLAEDLIETLDYNVDEKLAIENFCQQVCRKRSH